METNNSQNIPTDIVQAIDSADVYTKIESIGNSYGLLIDQIGQLSMDTEKLMIGQIKSADFVKTIAKNLEISMSTSEKIATDINTQILSSVRESLRKMQEIAENKPADPVERAAKIDIIPHPVSSSPQYNDHTLTKEEVLNDLENIKQMKPENAPNFVEHLLANPVVNAPIVPPNPNVPPKKPVPPPAPRQNGADPYREPIL